MREELDRTKGWIVSDITDTWVLRARGLRKEYGSGEGLVRAVDGVDLEVAPGETVAVMGPSGCGKSTLLHLLGGLDRPSGGEVSLAGRRIDQLGERALARMRRTAVGFVFQAFHLMEELTAVENVELPALLAERSPRAARQRAASLLERVGLADRAGFLPSALSGGQRQRVAIARALSNEPLVVLADEQAPLSSPARAPRSPVVPPVNLPDRLISMRDGAFVDETLWPRSARRG
jgi:putative ABC transport system ATP-binding protein